MIEDGFEVREKGLNGVLDVKLYSRMMIVGVNPDMVGDILGGFVSFGLESILELWLGERKTASHLVPSSFLKTNNYKYYKYKHGLITMHRVLLEQVL